jgi:eukaryotic-like serine/threonine-protein kinase
VADGLAAAHARGTVHRDVKPGNILVTDDDLAKISDFGIARTLGDEQITQTGMLVGTPLYFSPQLARGEDPVPADDVWALGATLYHAVEGEPPWPHRSNAIAMLTHIATQPPPAPRHPGPLAGVIRRAMDLDPAMRPTMAEVAEELRSLERGDPVPQPAGDPTVALPAPEPPPSPDPSPDPEPARRRRGLVVAVVLLVVLVAAGAALVLGPLRDDGSDRDPAADPGASPSGSPRPSRTPPPSQEAPSEEAPSEEAPSEETPSGAGTAEPPVGDPADFLVDYYAQLPDDTDAAWAMLAPSYQERLGRGTYDGFWATIDGVSVEETEPVGDAQVDVTLSYDGGQRETRRITVEPDGDGWLVVADEVVS